MKTIHKYPLNANGPTRVWIPGYRMHGPQKEVMTLATQHDRPQVWIGVDTDQPKVAYTITLVGTGHDVDQERVPSHALYIGTFLMYGDQLVLHAFLFQDPNQTEPDEEDEE